MDLSEYRNSDREKARIADLMAMLPDGFDNALDIGARDGFISIRLAERCQHVTALDLERPTIQHDKVDCIKGDITALALPDAAYDLVFCAEVLEHIPPPLLAKACAELTRVARRHLLIGVPYRQDIRVGRTTCQACGQKNPPWGHVNQFDESVLQGLFAGCKIVRQSFVGTSTARTNALSCLLLDWAGNPYGTYIQDESCVHCHAALTPPAARTVLQKVFTKLGFMAMALQQPFIRPQPNWIHILLEKPALAANSDQ